jgi:diguanylate cyclase (GGDEF)-like protein
MGSTMNRWMVIAMPLRANYVVKRLGPGPEYAAIRTGLGGIFAFAGRRTRADRIMAEVNRSIAGLHDPGLVASTQCLQAISSEMIVPTVGITGVRTRHALSAHGRWLSAGDYLHAVFVLGNTLLGRGHLTEAAEWHQRATARSGEAVSNATLGAQIAALAGRPAEAATSLGQARELVRATPSNYGQTLSIAVCAVRIAVESGDTGAGFEEAVREVDELNPTPSRIWNSHRFVFVHLAFGRLAQVVAQPPASRGEQLAQAAAAVATLRRMANGPVLRAYHRAALAFLEYLQGKHPAALRQLADLEISSADLDLPLLCYEMALLRARIHRDLGHPDHAVQQATVALTLAQRHGWPTRARWIRVEFDMSTPQLADQAQSQARSLHASTAKGHVDERRLGALQQVSLAAADAGSPARLAQVALDQIVSIFNAERAFLFLHDPGTDRLAPYLGRDHNGAELDALTGYGSTLIQRVADSGEALVVAGSEEGAALGSQSTMAHGLRSIMIAPMRLGERLIGLVYLDSRIAKGIFTTDDIDLLAAITTLFGLSLEMARAGELETAVAAAERERDLADRLRSATTQLGASLEPDEVAGTLTALVCQILHVDTAALVQRIAGKVMLMGAQDGVQPTLDPDLDPGLAAALAATEPCCGSRDSGLPPPPGPLGPDATSWLAIPLILRGEHRGVLLAASAAPRGYSDAELHIAAALAGQGLAALDNAVLFQRVQDLATRDGLTGLFNRRHFTALTEQPATGPTSTAAIMVDIDHFKRINDTHGHPVGDDVIRTVAARLHAALRDCDVICRYGGEEFAILLPDVTRPIAERISRRLLAAITSTPIPTAAGDLSVTVSIGVAGPGNLDDDVWALLGTADTALYQAKNGGRNQAVHLDAPPSHAH